MHIYKYKIWKLTLFLVAGGWGEWELSSEMCSRPCGAGGVLQMVRQCNNPEPLYNGSYCRGNAVSEESCNENIQCKGECRNPFKTP